MFDIGVNFSRSSIIFVKVDGFNFIFLFFNLYPRRQKPQQAPLIVVTPNNYLLYHKKNKKSRIIRKNKKTAKEKRNRKKGIEIADKGETPQETAKFGHFWAFLKTGERKNKGDFETSGERGIKKRKKFENPHTRPLAVGG